MAYTNLASIIYINVGNSELSGNEIHIFEKVFGKTRQSCVWEFEGSLKTKLSLSEAKGILSSSCHQPHQLDHLLPIDLIAAIIAVAASIPSPPPRPSSLSSPSLASQSSFSASSSRTFRVNLQSQKAGK